MKILVVLIILLILFGILICYSAVMIDEKVIRCKECKWWADNEDYDCEIHSGAWSANDFCSYVERSKR